MAKTKRNTDLVTPLYNFLIVLLKSLSNLAFLQIMINKSSFLKVFHSTFWKRLNQSIVPFEDGTIIKKDFLENLYKEISDYSYTPSAPREYIVFNKHNGVPRYIPTFTRKDACVYFFCMKLLEKELAVNRVSGTFGGWSLGNAIREKEENEILEVTYVPINSVNPFAWVNQWINFQNVVKLNAENEIFNYYVKLDIANFYDTIDLRILESKIRHAVDKSKQDIVTLLIYFLSSWNKRFEGYANKKIGIPQEDIGDCSRILANFFLQDYDLAMKHLCRDLGAEYVRFADDQVFYVKTKEDCQKVISEASRNLFSVNLNINSGKVKEFTCKEEFNEYWAFEIIDKLNDRKNQIQINSAIDNYFDNLDKNVEFRQNSVLKKLLSVDFNLLTSERKSRLLNEFYNSDFLSTLSFWHLEKIREKVANDELLFQQLDEIAEKVVFNSFLYNLMSLYKKHRKDYDFSKIIEYIDNLKF